MQGRESLVCIVVDIRRHASRGSVRSVPSFEWKGSARRRNGCKIRGKDNRQEATEHHVKWCRLGAPAYCCLSSSVGLTIIDFNAADQPKASGS